jgi:hypothetical protein
MNRFALLLALLGLILTVFPAAGEEKDPARLRKEAYRLHQEGNYQEAFVRYRALCLEVKNDPLEVAGDFTWALSCLQNLNRTNEIDAFREKAIAAHAGNWRLLQAAARSYRDGDHFGFIIAGEFHRGSHRGGGEYANAFERDRVRALQLFNQALPFVEAEPRKNEAAALCLDFAATLNAFGGISRGFRLHALTDLETLPDYETGYGYDYRYGQRPQGASVDAEGRPLFHKVPESFAAAATDGERWRWLLQRAGEIDAGVKPQAVFTYASFLHELFGVQTLREYGPIFLGRQAEVADRDQQAGPYQVHTLGDDETLAKLAVGVRRLALPGEHNFIRLFEEVTRLPDTGFANQATARLGQIYENRRQYDRALPHWERYKKYDKAAAEEHIGQITGNWGVFEGTGVQPASRRPGVDYRFRNGTRVEFEAFRVRLDKLLEDVKAHVRSRPERLDWNRLNVSDIGRRLVYENQGEYLGERVAGWSLALDPDKRRWDRRVSVSLPEELKPAGAYLLTAKLKDGNTARTIVFTADTAIVEKPLHGQVLYYVADAVSGNPLADQPVEFFGYRTRNVKGTSRYEIEITEFARKTDADGQVILSQNEAARDHQWLITARTAGGRLAYLGFTHLWNLNYADPEYNQVKTFVMTDRPVYRPKDKVQFKLWAGQTKYDRDEKSPFAGRSFNVAVLSPRNEQVFAKTLTADEFGGVEAEFELAADAPLGVYGITHGLGGATGGASFRVEEYKKPEFEVKVEAPSEPVSLGEKIEAVIQAHYYFGAPVAQATVKYKVLRHDHDSRWYPALRWDWLYGRGYWWFAYDYDWLPGWERWGCLRPRFGWWPPGPRTQPEVVAEGEAPVGADGTLKVPIDTGLAKYLYGDRDHRYAVEAEVRDLSRRTIVGKGDVLVAREPFKVYAWTDRGHYRTEDTIQAGFRAQTLDQKPVKGRGVLKLMRLEAGAGKTAETEAERWGLDTDAAGEARIKIRAARPGQYRLAFSLTDEKNHTIEGGYVFAVRGAAEDPGSFRFAKLELIADKTEYIPGETLRLMVNTDRAGAAVLLFIRPVGGVALPPRLIRPQGKSAVEEIAVTAKDMPNFFVEALTVYDGKVHSEVREIAVPPEKRVLDVAVLPSQKTYRPGEKAGLKIRLTDPRGEPFQGEAVLTVYDRALEYISGGSNAPEIRAFFWKWRRQHSPRTQSSLNRRFANLLKKDEAAMRGIGVFGDLVEDTKEAGRERKNEAALASADAVPMAKMAAGPAMPAPAAPAAAQEASGGMRAEADKKEAESGPAGGDAAPEGAVRTEFADTAFWAARVKTDAGGVAEVDFKLPENLTAWKVKVWAMGSGTRVGEGATEVVTAKDLILRLQAPRFFVETDEVVLSANVHNYLETEKSVKVRLELEGGCLVPMSGEEIQRTVAIPAKGEKRVDWRVKAQREGEAIVRMRAAADKDSDAMQMRFPVLVHGFAKQVPQTGVIRPEQSEASLVFKVPAERRVDQSRLELRYSPTLAAAMVDALPYLADYPYGCTEQTLNRFLPTVITQRVLQKMGVDLARIQAKQTNLNPQEIGDDKARARQWQKSGANPVFDEAEVAAMVAAGIKRLAGMQLADGGWGWFSGYGERSYPHTTALVVHGLQIAAANDVKLPPEMIDRGAKWLKSYQDKEVARLKEWDRTREKGKPKADNLDAFLYMVLVDQKIDNPEMRAYLYRDRNELAVYAKAMFGVALHAVGDKEKLSMILRNIEQYLKEDNENQTAWLELPNSGYWWSWYGSEMETHGYYLKLISRMDPTGGKASRLVKYLLNNRKHATYWNSTRDTAVIVEAFADYLAATKETDPNLTIEILYDGKRAKTVTIDRNNLFTFDNQFVLEGAAVASGAHTLAIKKTGRGPLYFNAYLDYFSLEDFITAAGLEVKVERKVYRLKEVDKKVKSAGARGEPLDKKVPKYERELLSNLATLKSGELVEVELTIESKNDYEYLVFEDMKAAGFEPVEVRSGYTGNAMGAYVEFRDQKVCFFVQHLARGKHSVSYRLRAEIPGNFSALPTRAYAMYAPELKGNSDEIKLNIAD